MNVKDCKWSVFVLRSHRARPRASFSSSPVLPATGIPTPLTLTKQISRTNIFKITPLFIKNPVIHVSEISIHHIPNLKLLRITIDKHQTWLAFLHHLKVKLIVFYHNLLKMTAKTWSISNLMLKVWYRTTMEKIITYGASIQ